MSSTYGSDLGISRSRGGQWQLRPRPDSFSETESTGARRDMLRRRSVQLNLKVLRPDACNLPWVERCARVV